MRHVKHASEYTLPGAPFYCELCWLCDYNTSLRFLLFGHFFLFCSLLHILLSSYFKKLEALANHSILVTHLSTFNQQLMRLALVQKLSVNMQHLIFSVLSVLSVLPVIFTAPVSHQSGGAEHIILLNKTDPSTPSIAAILNSLSLSETHNDVKHIYNNSAFLGFSARMKSHCLNILANTTGVTHIEPAVRVASTDLDSITDSPWGLQRLSSSAVSIEGDTDELNYTYTYANNLLGKGADIYIMDTGIFTQHVVFGGRATMGWSFDGNMTDDDGHGTHVSGIAAGERVGVAQGANLIGVRVLGGDGGGWSSDVVKGVFQHAHLSSNKH